MRCQWLLAALVAAFALPAVAADPDKFTAHEWGTFSTFAGSDGKFLKFTPDDTDLPGFVHSLRHQTKGVQNDVLVSLETPVLYFYTDRDRSVSVHVEFPKGVMTDWYPMASRPPAQQIRWDDLQLFKTAKPEIPVQRQMGRYAEARDVESAYVQTAEQDHKREAEKFLFYRGVGDFHMPLEVRALGADKFTIVNTGKQAIVAHILVNMQNRKLKFKQFGKLAEKSEAGVELPAEESTTDALREAMVKLLTEQGLYEAEAKAMVKTWQRDWFSQEGTRVLYLVAPPVTEELLPMSINPKPDKLVRVLVGRHDVLTPEREKEIDALVAKLNGDSNAEARAADDKLNKLGRYRSAAQAAAEKRIPRR